MKKMKIDDDFQSYLTEGALFEGDDDIPCMLRMSNIKKPNSLVAFPLRKQTKNKNVTLHCFVHDYLFSSLITETRKHVEELTEFDAIICPDPTITIGGPKVINKAQVYFSRAVGFYLQKHGVFAIPCVRWGDQATFDYCFLGVPKDYIVAISTHGCIMPCKENGNELRNAFINGLPVMLERLKPRYVIIYGRMPEDIFGQYRHMTEFIHFDSDIQNYYNDRKAEKKYGS